MSRAQGLCAFINRGGLIKAHSAERGCRFLRDYCIGDVVSVRSPTRSAGNCDNLARREMHRIDADGGDCRDVVDGYSATGHDLDPARGMFDHSTDLVESLIASVRTPGRQHAGHAQVDQFVQRGQTVGHHVPSHDVLSPRPAHGPRIR